MTRDLTALRARLESLGAPHREARIRSSVAAARLPDGCRLEETPFGRLAVRREWFAGAPVESAVAIPRCLPFLPSELERPVFLDTETTGLSGGTGTVAFLVGMAWPEDGGNAMAQFFLSDLDQEKALLWAVGQSLSAHRVLVTYNGRSFDWPLLQTRLVMLRAKDSWPELPHLDLLGLVRRIFKPRLPDCALRTVEEAVLALQRDEDLPGWLIPSRYFGWLRGAPVSALEAVFAHNRQDVLSMPLLLSRLEAILDDASDLDPIDRFSRARFLEARGLQDEALTEYGRLWAAGLGGFQRGALGIRLARLLCRKGRWPQARAVLEECWMTQSYPYPAAIELARLLEHRARDPAAARQVVSQALSLLAVAAVPDARWQEDLERRRNRLDRRLGLRDDLPLALTG